MTEHYEIPLFPLNTVLFPGMVLPLHIFEERYKIMIQQCLAESRPFGVVLLKSGQAEGELGPVYEIGTTAEVKQVDRLPEGRMNIITVGLSRFRVLETHDLHPYLSGIVEDLPLEQTGQSVEINTLAKRISSILVDYLSLFKTLSKSNLEIERLPDDPEALGYLTAMVLPVSNYEKQQLLSIRDAHAMLEQTYSLLRHEIQILDILANERPSEEDDVFSFSVN
ncbi:MAG: LON peptidase substrate-binding domain-containing protein [Chloroflexi bacterium]|nr:LON peptidase substrate-binding domain-containing protein [Chloroflexota bacterium]